MGMIPGCNSWSYQCSFPGHNPTTNYQHGPSMALRSLLNPLMHPRNHLEGNPKVKKETEISGYYFKEPSGINPVAVLSQHHI
jgi:hypothetical protein